MLADAKVIQTPSSITPVQNRGAAYLAIVVTLGSIALLIYSLRVFTHGKLHRYFAIDDGLMLAVVVRYRALVTW